MANKSAEDTIGKVLGIIVAFLIVVVVAIQFFRVF